MILRRVLTRLPAADNTLGQMTLSETARRRLRACGACLGNSRGFSLIELLVVIIILGLLAGLVGPRLFSRVGQSKQAAARAQIELFSAALDQYRLDVGAYPASAAGLCGTPAWSRWWHLLSKEGCWRLRRRTGPCRNGRLRPGGRTVPPDSTPARWGLWRSARTEGGWRPP